ncbi:MAG: tetratricopeptide repeat protein [Candidatus Brocadiia bacterium]|jgi:tetratricopeptide (TPR) repeat protein
MLLLAAVIVYSDSFHGPFIFDDRPAIDQISAKEPWSVWHTLIEPRPVIRATLALNYFIGGYHETGYHVGNLCIHILAALALFGVIRRTLTLPSLGGRFDEKAAASLAFGTALLWAVHPLQTQAVTYIIQRMESLMGLFYLVTLYCFIRAESSPKPRAWHAAAAAACALGMGCKEVMVSAPLVVLLYDRCFVAGSFRDTLRRRWGFYLALAATWIILARSVIEGVSPHAISAGFQLKEVTPFEYARSEPGVILHYLALAFWPASLCLDYAWPVANGFAEIAPGALVVGALLAATIWALVRKPKWGFVGAWFFLILAPTSSIMPIKDLAFEHRMYLPLAAVVVVIILAAYLAWERWAGAGERRRLQGQFLAAILILSAAVALGYTTLQRNKDYATVMAIWSDTASKAPRNARALNNLGWQLREVGDYEGALDCLNRAIALRPRYADAYNNRAYTYASMKWFDKALDDCNMAIECRRDFATPYNNRGNLYEQLGELDKAIEDFNHAIRLKPDYHQAYNNRGLVRLKLGQYQDALKDFNKSVETVPDDPIPYRGRAAVYYRLQEYAKALADLETCERLHDHVDPAFRKAVMQAAGRSD